MLAARAFACGRFEFLSLPRPAAAPGKVLVRLERIGICGSDIELITRHRGVDEYPLPVGFSGHECIGTVEACDGVPDYSIGDRVLIVPPEANGFVEWFLADPERLVKQPPNVDPEILVVGQVLGTAI